MAHDKRNTLSALLSLVVAQQEMSEILAAHLETIMTNLDRLNAVAASIAVAVAVLPAGGGTITDAQLAAVDTSLEASLAALKALGAPATGGGPTVSINPPTNSLRVGQTAALVAVVTPAGGSLVWASDNAAVATVDPTSGVVTGVTPGTANISATYTVGVQQSAVQVLVTIAA